MNNTLFIRVFLLLFKHCLDNMPNLHSDLQSFSAKMNSEELYFVLLQNQMKSGKAASKCLVILRHRTGERRDQVKNSLGLEVSPNKTCITKQPILLWDC